MTQAALTRQSPTARQAFLSCAAVLAWLSANAELNLQSATVERLDNGLTMIVLEDRNFPVASVQSLYRVGARNEVTGATGLAHFLEHLAFRSSRNFPDTGLVSRIYAEGGEWHGYTWTDETTYFATVPAERLDLLLDIEADRMRRLTFSADVIAAERGAVLAEMHMYENDPGAMLIDALLYTIFVAHPYRNNTIGWESDVSQLSHEDALRFYEQHYHPANAVLAVVGDIDSQAVMAAIKKRFGKFKAQPATPLPHTLEPAQTGERRVEVRTGSEIRQFMIGFRAPSVNNPDFAAFLVLQEILASGSGVSFLQNDWGTPVTDAGLLTGAAENLTTWFPPSAQDYVFIVGGMPLDGQSAAQTEAAIDQRMAIVRDRMPTTVQLEEAIARIQDELVYDVQTTEDAAHQLAFYAGLGGLDVLLSLPARVSEVSAQEVQRVATRYLAPEQRSIAWHLPGKPPAAETARSAEAPAAIGPPRTMPDVVTVPEPEIRQLQGGLPVILQSSDLSSTVSVQVIFRGIADAGSGLASNYPLLGYSSATLFGRSSAWPDIAQEIESLLTSPPPAALADARPSTDPSTRLEEVFRGLMQPAIPGQPLEPVLLVVSGDITPSDAFPALEKAAGDVQMPAPESFADVRPVSDDTIHVALGREVSQAALGYIASVNGPGDPAADAHRLLLYILSHDYEGRLGKAAISDRGLAYYIDARYRTDGNEGWVTLAIGVDPEKAESLRSLLRAELDRLRDEPPTMQEIDEARRHFLGRKRSAAQSNTEITDALAREWLWYGQLDDEAALASRLARVQREDVLQAIDALTSGATVLVDE